MRGEHAWWDSIVDPRDRWVGRYPLTTWDSVRNLMAGDRRLVIWAEDAVTRNALDANPATAAYWDDEAEEWVGYEGNDGPGTSPSQSLSPSQSASEPDTDCDSDSELTLGPESERGM